MQKKVIIKQLDEKDCGVCCLESIIKYYDGYVPLEKIRKDSCTSTKGTSALHLVETLKKYGFDAYGSRIKKEKFFSTDIPLPAIIHVVLDNGLNHYMVLYEKRKNKVILMDPSVGKKVMSDTDFFLDLVRNYNNSLSKTKNLLLWKRTKQNIYDVFFFRK